MDEKTGAFLGGKQRLAIQREAQEDHPEHSETDWADCPVCYEEMSDEEIMEKMNDREK
jgi:hypothetical protein